MDKLHCEFAISVYLKNLHTFSINLTWVVSKKMYYEKHLN